MSFRSLASRFTAASCSTTVTSKRYIDTGFSALLTQLSSGRTQEQKEGRVRATPRKILPPYKLRRKELYSDKKPIYPKRPLMGPKTEIAEAGDPFHLTRSNPMDHVLNPNFVYSFVDPLGKIKTRAQTGLTWKTQKQIGKMVRRARAMGIIGRMSGVPARGGFGDNRV